jgi:hypothetical protein
MAAQRLIGGDTTIRVLSAGNLVEELQFVTSFGSSANFQIIEAGKLGETTQRFDMVFNGYSGDFEFQVERASWERFIQALERKARRLEVLVVNVLTTALFPDGSTNVGTFPDVAFGPFTEMVSSRADFVKYKTSFSSSEKVVLIDSLV